MNRAFIMAKNRKQPYRLDATKGGVNITTVKFQSQLLQVLTAFAFARVLSGLISAGSTGESVRALVATYFALLDTYKAMAVGAKLHRRTQCK